MGKVARRRCAGSGLVFADYVDLHRRHPKRRMARVADYMYSLVSLF